MNFKTAVKIRTLPDPKWPKPPINEPKKEEDLCMCLNQ